MQATGGRLIELYYAFGEYDGFVLLEGPDDIGATSGLVAAMGSGAFKALKTTKLLTVEEMLQALQRAGSVFYPAPASTARPSA